MDTNDHLSSFKAASSTDISYFVPAAISSVCDPSAFAPEPGQFLMHPPTHEMHEPPTMMGTSLRSKCCLMISW